ncbi:hypothetical protein K8I85_11190, partial [bacterium]|nr:hypothetical protein [bacterium]
VVAAVEGRAPQPRRSGHALPPSVHTRRAGAILLAGAWFLAALLAVSSAAWSTPAPVPSAPTKGIQNR